MLHEVPNVCCQIALFLFVDRVKSRDWAESKRSCETGSLHTKNDRLLSALITFWPVLPMLCVAFTHKLKCNRKTNIAIQEKKTRAQALISKPYLRVSFWVCKLIVSEGKMVLLSVCVVAV